MESSSEWGKYIYRHIYIDTYSVDRYHKQHLAQRDETGWFWRPHDQREIKERVKKKPKKKIQCKFLKYADQLLGLPTCVKSLPSDPQKQTENRANRNAIEMPKHKTKSQWISHLHTHTHSLTHSTLAHTHIHSHTPTLSTHRTIISAWCLGQSLNIYIYFFLFYLIPFRAFVAICCRFLLLWFF